MATKAQILAQLESQNWILTEEQKVKFKRFLYDYTVEPSDLPYLRKIALANGIEPDKFKDTVLFEKIKNDLTCKVEDAVVALDYDEKQEIKKDRFMRLKGNLPATIRGDLYDIEVVDLETFDGGLIVYARAFNKDGTQIGFGKDGTVDIERFRMFYIPTAARDDNGDIERDVAESDPNDPDGVIITKRKYREHLPRALAGYLERVIQSKDEKQDNSNIVAGKVGSTTTTASPEAGTGTYANDKQWYSAWSTSWATARAGTGFAGNSNDTSTTVNYFAQRTFNGLGYAIQRAAQSYRYQLPSGDTISSAKIILQLYGVSDDVNDAYSYVIVTNYTGAATGYSTSDWGNVGSTAYSAAYDVTSLSVGANKDFVLNSTAIAQLVADGTYNIFKCGWRGGHDFENNTGSLNTSLNQNSYASFYAADETTNDVPVLSIEHASSGFAYSQAVIIA